MIEKVLNVNHSSYFKLGLGRHYWKDGSYYIGQFENGEKNGFGKMVYSKNDDRESFEGCS